MTPVDDEANMALTDWRDGFGERYDGKRCLVTGGAGFIGSHLVEALVTLGAEVVVLDDLSGGSEANVRAAGETAGAFVGTGRLAFMKGSILDHAVLREAIDGCSLVFHQAALGSVPRSVAEPGKFQDVNTSGTFAVLEAARAAGVRRVMFAASSSAYGDSETLPKVETMPVRPKSPYAATKVAGEALLRAWAGSYGLDTCSLRYFNIFGPRQNANSAYAAVIAAFAKALGAGVSPVIYGDGEQSRDFTFVDNAVQANLLAGLSDTPLSGAVLNVACGRRVSVNELARQMAVLMGVPGLKPEYHSERAGDVKHSLAALDAIQAALGYTPVVEFARGLQATVAWYQAEMAETSRRAG